ncbi:hypothetical protein [Apilactobacillus xinyiensis]|uniref:hypothetical protein n=1 Tax=Apilactobacillus xinyiensis TaxID=2841032 RepID=UPI00200C4DAA|nr:hypothetical protein [Apilactobacillus xinyiensis]MCL0330660.1 hypothetical protein [Apilactobacillus xinyiensis]
MKQTLSSKLLDYEQDRQVVLENSQLSKSQLSKSQLAHEITMCESNMLEVLVTLQHTHFQNQQEMKRYVKQVLVDNHENSLTNSMANDLLNKGVHA